MKVGPVVHGALLVAALGFAYQTWTRDKSGPPKAGKVTVWKESADNFQSFAYDGKSRSIRVERRHDKSGSYLWGKVTEQRKKPHAKIPIHTPNPEQQAEKAGAQQEAKFKGKEEAIKARLKAARDAAAQKKNGIKGVHPAPRPHGLKPAPVDTIPHKPGAKKGGATTGHKAGGAGKAPQSPHYALVPTPPAKAPATTPATTPAKTSAPATTPAKTPPKSSAPAKTTTPKSIAPVKPGAGATAAGATSAAPGGASPIDTGSSSAGQSKAPAPDDTVTVTREFPIGQAGDELLENLSHLHALRDLGVLDDKQKDEYGIKDSKENLTVFFKGGVKHTLVIGSRVFGGSDRYVLEPDSGKGYVLSNSEILRYISGAETSLSLRVLHAFEREKKSDDEDSTNPHQQHAPFDRWAKVAKVDIESPQEKRSLVKSESDDPATGGHKVTWADVKTPKETDQSFANFLGQVGRLRPTEYDPKADAGSMTKVLTISYRDKSGKVIGTFDMYKKVPVTPEVNPSAATKNQTEYYVHTELTRVLGKVNRMAADRVAQDISQILEEAGKPGSDDKSKAAAPIPGLVPAPPGAHKATLPAPTPRDRGKAAPGNHAAAKPSPKAGNK